MHLEDVVAIRVLLEEVVVVAVVPGDPAAGAREQRRVQHLAVVAGRVVVGGEVRADTELLEHDRLAEAAGQLAREGCGERLAHLVVQHRIGVGAEEVDERRKRPERVAVVPSRDLDAPGAVAERDRLRRARRPHRLDQHAGPGDDLVAGRRPAVERHLVRHEPAHDGLVPAEPACDLVREPRLLRHEPGVPIEVPSLAPCRIPVLPGHVADDERGDRPEPGLDMRVEEVGEPGKYVLVEPLDLRHEVGPVAERARDVAPVLGQDGELFADDRRVVAAPHARPADARPEVRADPDDSVAGFHARPYPPLRRCITGRSEFITYPVKCQA